MGTATGPFGIFQINWKVKKKLVKWNVTVLNDDIVIYVIDQVYESDWFSEESMTKWKETSDNTKTWQNCQQFSKEANIARKRYNKAKGQTQETMNNVMVNAWNMYLEAMKAWATQEQKEQQEHIQQVTNQNATLVTMVQK